MRTLMRPLYELHWRLFTLLPPGQPGASVSHCAPTKGQSRPSNKEINLIPRPPTSTTRNMLFTPLTADPPPQPKYANIYSQLNHKMKAVIW